MGVNTEREQVYFDKWDEGALRGIIEQQKKITRKTKELGFKKLYEILVVIDDFADQPELHRRTGDGSHTNHLAAYRPPKRFLAARESSACACNGQTRSSAHSPRSCGSSFAQAPPLASAGCSSGSLAAMQTVLCLEPCPERPRQISDSTTSRSRRGGASSAVRKGCRLRSMSIAGRGSPETTHAFEFDIGETLHLQTGAKLSIFKMRVADAFLSTDRSQFLYWIDEALQTLNWAVLPSVLTRGVAWSYFSHKGVLANFLACFQCSASTAWLASVANTVRLQEQARKCFSTKMRPKHELRARKNNLKRRFRGSLLVPGVSVKNLRSLLDLFPWKN